MSKSRHLVEVTDATIATTSIEIKTVVIGKKQMTLSVFRQLPVEPLFDFNDPKLHYRGLLWGHVNYHWNNCAPNGLRDPHSHLHVVWQLGPRLVQTPIYKPCPFRLSRAREDPNAYIDEMITDDAYHAFEIDRYLASTPAKHPMYETCFAELQALDQLFIAV